MIELDVPAAPDLDAILAATDGPRLGRVSFTRPRVAQRRNARVAERHEVAPAEQPSVATVEPQEAAPAEPQEAAPAEPEQAVSEDRSTEVRSAEAGTVAEGVPADFTALLLQRMRATRAAHERLREAEEEHLRRRHEVVTAEAELDAEIIRVRARLESLAQLAPGTVRHASADEVGEAIALLRSQVG